MKRLILLSSADNIPRNLKMTTTKIMFACLINSRKSHHLYYKGKQGFHIPRAMYKSVIFDILFNYSHIFAQIGRVSAALSV